MPPKIGGVDSKFRNLLGNAWKSKYHDLRISTKTSETWGLAASCSFLAFPGESGSGGVVNVLDVADQIRSPPCLRISAHTGPVQEIAFSPFSDDLFLTSSDDGTVKIWQVPPKSKWNSEGIKDPKTLLQGHTKRCYSVAWNPVANNIVASGAMDSLVKVWNAGEGEEITSISIPDNIFSLAWNSNGSLLATASRDKKLRILDPRASTSITAEVPSHDGPKGVKVTWIEGSAGRQDRLLTTGFSKSASRQLFVWDSRNLSSGAVKTLEIDRQAAFLLPYWDESTGLLYIAGKGESTVKPFLVLNGEELHALSNTSLKTPFKGLAFAPKRAVDVTECEIQRAYFSEPSAIQPLSFVVPRKKSDEFHQDLYPDILANEPAMEANDWKGGKTASLHRQSLNPSKNTDLQKKLVRANTSEISPKDIDKEETFRAKKGEGGLSSEKTATKSPLKKLETKPSVKLGTTKSPLKKLETKPSLKKIETTVKPLKKLETKPSLKKVEAVKSPLKKLDTTKTIEKKDTIKSPLKKLDTKKTIERKKTLPSAPDRKPTIPKIDVKKGPAIVRGKLGQKEEDQLSVSEFGVTPGRGEKEVSGSSVPGLDFSKIGQRLDHAKSLVGDLDALLKKAEQDVKRAKEEQKKFEAEFAKLKAKASSIKT